MSTRPFSEQNALLQEHRLLEELRTAVRDKRSLSVEQRRFVDDFTSAEHKEYRKVLVEIVNVVQYSATEHGVE